MKNDALPILIVDNDITSRQVLQEYLSSLGYPSLQCEGGQSAIECLKKEEFSIVLLDLKMPEIDGFTVLKHIKSVKKLSHLPVIIISSMEDDEKVSQCIEMGAEDFINKPFNPTMLNARIKNANAKNNLRDQELLHAKQIKNLESHSSDVLYATQSSSGELRKSQPNHAGIIVCGFGHFPDYQKKIPLDTIESQRKSLIALMRKVCSSFGLEEISTSNSCFIFLCKPSNKYSSLETHIVKCALNILSKANLISNYWNCKIGIHTAKMGTTEFSHVENNSDPWNEMITTAARLESMGAQNAINVSDNIWKVIKEGFQKNEAYITIAVRGELNLHQIHIK